MPKKWKERFRFGRKKDSAHGDTGSAPSSVLSSPSSQSNTLSATHRPAPSWSSDPTHRSPSAPPSTSIALSGSDSTLRRLDSTVNMVTPPTEQAADAIPPTPSTPPVTNELHSTREYDTSLLSGQVEVTRAQPRWITTTIRRSVTLLKILSVILGAPAIDTFLESVDVNEDVSPGRNVLEGHCSSLGELIKTLMEKEGGNIPLPLKNGLNELYRELGSALKELRKSKGDSMVAEEASRKITEAVDMMITEATSHYIKDLLRVNAAYNDYMSENKRRATCFKGTREALLKAIEDWVPQMQGSRFYLISGIAGIGKSTVAQTIAQWADSHRYLGASFFFSRDEKERSNAARFFTSIAYQLCIHDEEFAILIGRALRTKEGIDAATKDPMTQLDVLLLKPLRKVKPRSQTTAIVIDALDECDEEDGGLVLKGMRKIVEELHFVKAILTTRPQPHLQLLLDDLATLNIVHLQDIDKEVVDGDIRRYLQYSLSQEQVKVRLSRVQQWSACDEEVEALVHGAGRLFIIASTAVLFILDKVARDPASQMKLLQRAIEEGRTPFDSLNDFYTIILRSAVPVECPVHIVQRYQIVVGAIVLIQSPLPIETLAKLISINSEGIRAVLENLQPVILLSGSGDVPLVYHKSFPDYLMDVERCKDQSLHIVPKGHHTRLALCCLQTMNKHLKHNILGLGDPARYFDNNKALEEEGRSEKDVQQAIPPELQYAATHWANHIKHADPEDSTLMSALKTLCEEHVIHWFEALSWIRQLGTASVSLDVVSKFQMADSDVSQIFSDAFRFISRHYHRIDQSALYMYHSALPFTPTESLLYNAFKKETFHKVEGGPAQWGALISTLRYGTGYFNVMFSRNSLQLASWDDETTKVWNATTGTLVRTFDGPRAPPAKDFSVVALLQGSLVMVYGLSSGAPITSFDPPATVAELALSFDGSRLATGLENGTVSVWDVENHELMGSLDDYDCPALAFRFAYRQLDFSPSSYMLAFMTGSGINLWNGRLVARLEHQSEKPVKMIFSSNGTRLASLAHGNIGFSLRLWNGENGSFIGMARTVGEELAISADGSLLATGGWDKREVQLWSGDSLSLVNMIPITQSECLAFSGDMLGIGSDFHLTLYDVKNHASIATLQTSLTISLEFSPDGTRLAAAGRDGAMGLWDVPAILKASLLDSEHQQSPVSDLAFSPDCSRLACGFEDGTIELWDIVHARKTISRHKLHSSPVGPLAFSPDGNELASGASDVRFWDGRDGTPTGILEYALPSELHSMALSSSLLAVAAKDVTTLWDRQSRHLIHTISQDCRLLSLSLDGSILVFVAHNSNSTSCVNVWDTEKRTLTTSINVDSRIHPLFLSPDGSRCAMWTHDALKLFDILNKKPIESLEYNDLSWVPHLNRIPISFTEDPEHWHHLVGRFSARHGRVPVLWLPRDFSMPCFDARPSIVALGSVDGRILLIRSATEIRAPI